MPSLQILCNQTAKFWRHISRGGSSTAVIVLAGAKHGGPTYAVEANPAYTTGPMGIVPGYPQQGPVAVGPGYPQQGYGPGGAPAYPPTGPYYRSGESPWDHLIGLHNTESMFVVSHAVPKLKCVVTTLFHSMRNLCSLVFLLSLYICLVSVFEDVHPSL